MLRAKEGLHEGILVRRRAGLGHPSGARGQSLWDLPAKETQYFMRPCGKRPEFGGDQAQEADGEVT
ncbi:MAG: hypothetical protein ACREV4_06870 [Gammaproteobacteria bacterium]